MGTALVAVTAVCAVACVVFLGVSASHGARRTELWGWTKDSLESGDAKISAEEVEQLQEAMEMDYETGAIVKDKIIPNAVEWFTGEANEDESDDEDFSDEDEDDFDEDDEDSEDEDDSDDEDAAPKKGKGKKGGADGEEKPPECKQQ